MKLETQEIGDFQCLCRSCNLRKSRWNQKEKNLGKRIPATEMLSLKYGELDLQGDETLNFNDPNRVLVLFGMIQWILWRKFFKKKILKFQN